MEKAQWNANNWVWGLGLFAVILVPSFRSVDYKDFASSLCFFSLLSLWALRFAKKKEVYFSSLDFFFLLYAGWVVVSTAWSPQPAASWEFLERFLPWLGIYGIERQEEKGESPFRLGFWAWGTAAVCVYAVLQKCGWDFIPAYAQNGSSARVFSTFGNPSVFAAFLVLAWPNLLLRPLPLKNPHREIGFRIFLGFVLWGCLLLTASRAGLLALGLQFLLLLFLLGSKAYQDKKWKWGMAAAGLLLLLSLGGMGLKIGARPTERLEVWKGAAAMALDRPLTGWGVNQFSLHFAPYQTPELVRQMNQDNTFAEHAHNEVLELWVELGVPGLLLAGIFWFSLLDKTFQKISGDRKNPRVRPLPVLGLFLGLAGAGITNLFDYNCRLSGVGFFIWLTAGLLANRVLDHRSVKISRIPVFFLFWGALAFSLGGALFQISSLGNQWRGSTEKDFLKDLPVDLSDEETKLLDAVRKDPRNPTALHDLGNVYAKLGKMDDAGRCYMAEIIVDPNSPGAFLNLGNIYFMESGKDPGNLGKALSYYRQSLALDPGSVEAHFNLAYVFFVQKDLSDALSQVDEVLKLDPRNAKALALRRQILP